MGRCCTGYTAISGGMFDMAHSYGARWWLAAAWRLHSSHGYGLFGAKMPSEKMRLMRGLRGAECELERAAQQGLLDLPSALTRLLTTTFYAPANLVRDMLARDAARKTNPPPDGR